MMEHQNARALHTISCIERIWQERFEQAFLSDVRKERTVSSPDKRYSFRLFYSKNREDWNKKKESDGGLNAAADCFLCDRADEDNWVGYDCSISALINTSPVMRCHCLAAPQSHRPWLETADMESFHALISSLGYSGFANLPGAGAGFPSHIHFQMFPERLNIFDEAGTEEIFSDASVTIDRLIYPAYGLRMGFRDGEGKSRIFSCIERYNKEDAHYTFNLLFSAEALYFVPRTKEIPAAMASFKFASAEMGGLFFVRTREMFDSADYAFLESAVKDVTLTDPAEQKRLEERVISYFR